MGTGTFETMAKVAAKNPTPKHAAGARRKFRTKAHAASTGIPRAGRRRRSPGESISGISAYE
jgi:hypothetical protein